MRCAMANVFSHVLAENNDERRLKTPKREVRFDHVLCSYGEKLIQK